MKIGNPTNYKSPIGLVSRELHAVIHPLGMKVCRDKLLGITPPVNMHFECFDNLFKNYEGRKFDKLSN